MAERRPPVYRHAPRKTIERRSGLSLRRMLGSLLDGALFLGAAAATLLLAWLLLQQGLQLSWWMVVYFVLLWVVTANLALPRLHLALTSIYVPSYFIGRSRTGSGLLGDPVNLALDGDEVDIHTAMRRAGWTLADPINLGSSFGIVWGSISGRSYPEAPVSSLYLFGRRQDFAYQMEVDGSPSRRHHVRFWRCPDGWHLPGGEKVDWLAAGTYDRAVGLSLFTLQITHKIDENIDIERDFIVDSVLFANSEADLRVIENFSTGYHCRNGGGDVVQTDGDLPVLNVHDVVAQAEPKRLPGGEFAVNRRPASVVAGVILALLFIVFETLELVMDLFPQAISGAETDRIFVFFVLLVFTAIFILNAVCIWFTYVGRSWARRLVVVCTTVIVFWGLLSLSKDLNAAGSVLALAQTAVGVFLIYALTGPAARDWGRAGQFRSSSVR